MCMGGYFDQAAYERNLRRHAKAAEAKKIALRQKEVAAKAATKPEPVRVTVHNGWPTDNDLVEFVEAGTIKPEPVYVVDAVKTANQVVRA